MTDTTSRNLFVGNFWLNRTVHADYLLLSLADKGGNVAAPGKGPAAPSKRREQVRQAQRYGIIPR